MNIEFEQYFTQGLILPNYCDSEGFDENEKRTTDKKVIVLSKIIKNYDSNKNQCTLCLDHLSSKKNEKIARLFCCGVELHERCLETFISKDFTKCMVCSSVLPIIKS